MNGCPCGYYCDPVKQCACTSAIITRYQKRISGLLLETASTSTSGTLWVLPRMAYEKLSDNRTGETSAAIRARV